MGVGLQPYLEQTLASGNTAALPGLLASFKARTGVLGLAVFDPQGQFLGSVAGPSDFCRLAPSAGGKALASREQSESAFGHSGDVQWLKRRFRCTTGTSWKGR